MNSLRKWLYKPKKTDQSLLAQFFYADEDLNAVASELDSFDGRKDPDRCTALVNHLRQCQDKVLNICQMIMDEVIPEDRAPRDFRAKFPDDVLQENLAGQLWFGAECLAAGSSILNREQESITMRPLAKALTKSLENVRNLLREQCFRNPPEFTEKICESLKILDRLFAEFELSYVSAMVPVKTVHEYEAQQAITVLFSETLQRALNLGLLTQDQVDSCDPALMFTIPRLAIVAGLLIFPDGPLCLDHGELSDMFRPFRSLLLKIRELLWTLSRPELSALERALCSAEEPSLEPSELDECKAKSNSDSLNNPQSSYYGVPAPIPPHVGSTGMSEVPLSGPSAIQDYLDQLYKDFPQCKEFITDLCHSSSNESHGHESNSVGNVEANDNTNEMTMSQYSMNLNESGGNGGGVANRHQLDIQAIVQAMVPGYCTEDNISTNSSVLDCISQRHSLNNYCDGEETESEERGTRRTPRTGTQSELDSLSTTESQTLGEQSHFLEEFEPVEHQRPTEFIGLTKSHSYSSYDDDLPTPVVEIRAEGSVLVEPSNKTHSSSSSHDSGLSSIADTDKSIVSSSPVNMTGDETEESPQSCFQFLTSQGGPNQDKSSIGSSFKTNSRDNNPSCSPPSSIVGNGCSSALNMMNLHQQHGSNYPDFHVGTGHSHQRTRVRSQGQESSSGSFCNSECSTSLGDESVCETSSFDSECQDDIEIALAMQAAEIATRNEARSRFKNSADLIHRLFICISGVADQLQTNYAADLRSTLKCVFAMNATPCEESPSCSGSSTTEQDVTPEPSLDEDLQDHSLQDDQYQVETSQSTEVISPPSWVPDQLAPQCMSCLATFTVVRRRHHCRNCGKVFCGKCSGNSVSLPRYGHLKPVRVCNRCFLYCVTPFTLPAASES